MFSSACPTGCAVESPIVQTFNGPVAPARRFARGAAGGAGSGVAGALLAPPGAEDAGVSGTTGSALGGVAAATEGAGDAFVRASSLWIARPSRQPIPTRATQNKSGRRARSMVGNSYRAPSTVTRSPRNGRALFGIDGACAA